MNKHDYDEYEYDMLQDLILLSLRGICIFLILLALWMWIS